MAVLYSFAALIRAACALYLSRPQRRERVPSWRKTLYDKIWDAHLVHEAPGETPVLYIDRHLVHEVTSPQAFEGLRTAGRKVRRPELTLAVADHNVPTKDRDQGIADPESARADRDPGKQRARIRRRIFRRWTISARASCISSGRSRAGPCRAPPSSAATATPPPMARSARWRSASARREVEHVLATQTLLTPSNPRTCASP